MDSINELMEIQGIQTSDASELMKNLSMFHPILIHRTVDALPYLYIRAFLHMDARYPYRYHAGLSHSDEYCLIFTKEGEGVLTIGDSEVHAGVNSLCFFPLQLLTFVRISSSQWEYYQMIFGGSQAFWFYKSFVNELPYYTRLPSASRLLDMICTIEADREYYIQSPFRQLSALTALLCEIIDVKTTDMEENSIPSYLLAIRQDFDTHFSRYYSLDMLEKKYKINKYKLAKEFTAYFGTSPINYLTRQRIEAAKNILTTTDLKIYEAGQAVGYENTTHFINSFKKQTGMTPSIYRKNKPRSGLI